MVDFRGSKWSITQLVAILLPISETNEKNRIDELYIFLQNDIKQARKNLL